MANKAEDIFDRMLSGSASDVQKQMLKPIKKITDSLDDISKIAGSITKSSSSKSEFNKNVDKFAKAFTSTEEIKNISETLEQLNKSAKQLEKDQKANRQKKKSEDIGGILEKGLSKGEKSTNRITKALEGLHQAATKGHSVHTHDFTAVRVLTDIAHNIRIIGKLMQGALPEIAKNIKETVREARGDTGRAAARASRAREKIEQAAGGSGRLPVDGGRSPTGGGRSPVGSGKFPAGDAKLPTGDSSGKTSPSASTPGVSDDYLKAAAKVSATDKAALHLKRHKKLFDISGGGLNDLKERIRLNDKITTSQLEGMRKVLRQVGVLKRYQQESLATEWRKIEALQREIELLRQAGMTEAQLAKQNEALTKSIENAVKRTASYGGAVNKAVYGSRSETLGKVSSKFKEAAGRIGEILGPLDKVAHAFTSFLPQVNLIDHFTKSVKEGAKWTSDISKNLYEIYGATGDVTVAGTPLQKMYHQVGVEIADAYTTTGQMSEVFRKQLLKNLHRGITEMGKWDRLTKSSLATATILGTDAESTADEFADWFQHMKLTVGQTEMLGRNLQSVSRLSGVTGQHLLDAVKGSKEFAQVMRDTGNYTDEVAKTLASIQVEAKKAGTTGATGEILKGITSAPGFFQESNPQMQALLANAAAKGGVTNQLQQGTILKSDQTKKAFAAGLRGYLKDFTGGFEKLEDIPEDIRAGLEIQAKAAFGKSLGELYRTVDALDKAFTTTDDKIADLNKQLENNVLTTKERAGLQEQLNALQKQKLFDKNTGVLGVLEKLNEFAKTNKAGGKGILDEFSKLTGKGATREELVDYTKSLVPTIQEQLDTASGSVAAAKKKTEEELAKAEENKDKGLMAALEKKLSGIVDLSSGINKQKEDLAKLTKDLESGEGDPAKFRENLGKLSEMSRTGSVQEKLQGLDVFTKAEYIQNFQMLTLQQSIEENVRNIAGWAGADTLVTANALSNVTTTLVSIIGAIGGIAGGVISGIMAALSALGLIGGGGAAAAGGTVAGLGLLSVAAGATVIVSALAAGGLIAKLAYDQYQQLTPEKVHESQAAVTKTARGEIGEDQLKYLQDRAKDLDKYKTKEEKIAAIDEGIKQLDQAIQFRKKEINSRDWRAPFRHLSGTTAQSMATVTGQAQQKALLEKLKEATEKGKRPEDIVREHALKSKIRDEMNAPYRAGEGEAGFKVRQRFGISPSKEVVDEISKNWDTYKEIDKALWDGNPDKAIGLVKANKNLNGPAVKAIFDRYEQSVPSMPTTAAPTASAASKPDDTGIRLRGSGGEGIKPEDLSDIKKNTGDSTMHLKNIKDSISAFLDYLKQAPTTNNGDKTASNTKPPTPAYYANFRTTTANPQVGGVTGNPVA